VPNGLFKKTFEDWGSRIFIQLTLILMMNEQCQSTDPKLHC